MTEFITFNKILFNTIKDSITGGDEAEKSFVLRQRLKNQTYQSMLKLWGSLNEELEKSVDKEVKDDHGVREAMRVFYEEILVVYNQFEEGSSYDKIGVFESFAEKAGGFVHKNLFTGNDSTKKEIEYEFEQFWNNFFKIKGVARDTKKKNELEELNKSIVQLGSRALKRTIASGLNELSNAESKTEDPKKVSKGFSISEALKLELNESKDLYIEFAEAVKYAKLITQNIGADWIHKAAEELTQSLSNGRMLDVNASYRDYLDNTFIMGNAYTTYLSAGDYKTIYMLIKEGGRHPSLIKQFKSEFEGASGIKILDDKEDTDFIGVLVKACRPESMKSNESAATTSDDILTSQEGIVNAMLTKVRLLNKELSLADNDLKKKEAIIQNYIEVSSRIHDVLTRFKEELAKLDLTSEIIEILKTQDHPELYRYWVNKPFWANETKDILRSQELLFKRLKDTEGIMNKMIEKSFHNQNSENQKEGDELIHSISDASVRSISFMIFSRYERQLLWYLENTLQVELELQRRERLTEVMDSVADSVSRQFKLSLFYRLALISNEDSMIRGKDAKKKSFHLFEALTSVPDSNRSFQSIKKDLKFEEVNDLYSARIYVDNFIHENQIDTSELEKFCTEYQYKMKEILKKMLRVQFMYYFPGSVTINEIDPNITYDLTTIHGVLGEFIRNVFSIVETSDSVTTA